jgi:Flp pilus assembly protein TadG
MIPTARMRRAFGRTDGTAMVEFALVLPLLLIIIWGIVDISRVFEAVNAVTSAVRDGARQAAVVAPSDTGAAESATIQTYVATDLATLGAPQPYTVQVNVVWDAPQDSVTAVYTFEPLTPLIGTFQFTRSAAFRWEQAATAP